jgi:uncharacterized repeat protein (TIGR03803 family)
MLAGCGAPQAPWGVPRVQSVSDASERAFRVIYWFTGRRNGWPHGYGPHELIALNGKLYGVTAFGGEHGKGVVFEMSPWGDQRVLYSFKGSPDGELPAAALVAYRGNLYGTTVLGGEYGGGTVFKISTSGDETVVHSFTGGSDGSMPEGPLIPLGRKLYGTTPYGGNRDQDGTVYEITPNGDERVIHHFGSRKQDYASIPVGGLAVLDGKLFGTAGSAEDSWGVLFTVTPSGVYHNLHRFSYLDGAEPAGTLVTFDGRLYGETAGQIDAHGKFHSGVVFTLKPPRDFRILARVGGVHGGNPTGSLAVLNGALYGVSPDGDAYNGGGVFEVTPAGEQRLIYSFHRQPDGRAPTSLTTLDGRLYGAMGWGGQWHGGGGTIYELQPP